MPIGARPNPPAHCAHFTVNGTVDGFPVANTFWVRNGNAVTPSGADFTSFNNKVGEHFGAFFCPQLSNRFALTDVEGLYYDQAGAELAAGTSHTNPGGKPVGCPPLNVSMCVGWRVQQHYRGGHPRTYLPAPPLDAITNGRSFTAGYASAVAGAAANFHSNINAISFGAFTSAKLGIVSFVLRKEWRSPPVFRDFVTGGAHCDTRIDSQRRRLGHDIAP